MAQSLFAELMIHDPFGTQEARPGPSVWSPMGAQRKAKLERCVELRSGVGPVHTTVEVAEGNEAHGGKGPA